MEGFYLISGPASVKVVSGFVDVLGFRVLPPSFFVVPIGRSVLARISGEVVISSGSMVSIDGSSYEFLDSVASIVSGYDRIMVVGPMDSGKSTLSAWVLNKMYSKGVKAYYLMVDIGQNEVYCPGFVTLASPKPPVIPGYSGSFEEVKPCFVGSFTPSEAIDRYVACVSKLSKIDKPLVMDTDGWVSEEGLNIKAKLARIAGVKVIVTLGLDDRMLEELKSNVEVEILSLPRIAPHRKDREDRRIHRERLIKLRLLEAKPVKVKAEGITVEGLPVLRGKMVDPSIVGSMARNIVYAELLEEGSLVVVYRGRPPGGLKGLLLPEGWEKGLLVAVECDNEVKPGVIEKIDYRSRSIIIITTCKGKVERIEVGKARVDLELVKGG